MNVIIWFLFLVNARGGIDHVVMSSQDQCEYNAKIINDKNKEDPDNYPVVAYCVSGNK